MSIEFFEEYFLKNADICRCGTKLESFQKFTAGTEFVWLGWCPKCNMDKVSVHGNNPINEVEGETI